MRKAWKCSAKGRGSAARQCRKPACKAAERQWKCSRKAAERQCGMHEKGSAKGSGKAARKAAARQPERQWKCSRKAAERQRGMHEKGSGKAVRKAAERHPESIVERPLDQHVVLRRRRVCAGGRRKKKKNGVTRRTRKIPSFLAVLPAHPLSLSSPPSRLCPSCALPGNTTSCPLTPSTMITSIKALLQSKERPAFPCGDARSPSKKSSACASSLARNLRRCSMSVRPQTRRNVPL